MVWLQFISVGRSVGRSVVRARAFQVARRRGINCLWGGKITKSFPRDYIRNFCKKKKESTVVVLLFFRIKINNRPLWWNLSTTPTARSIKSGSDRNLEDKGEKGATTCFTGPAYKKKKKKILLFMGLRWHRWTGPLTHVGRCSLFCWFTSLRWRRRD